MAMNSMNSLNVIVEGTRLGECIGHEPDWVNDAVDGPDWVNDAVDGPDWVRLSFDGNELMVASSSLLNEACTTIKLMVVTYPRI